MSYQSVTTASTGAGTATSLACSKPAGTAAGDTLLGVVVSRGTSVTITPPAGWTGVIARTHATITTLNLRVFVLTAGASEPSTYTASFSASVQAVFAIIRADGIDLATPVDVSGFADSTANGTAVTSPSVSPTQAGDLLVTIAAARGIRTATPPGGATERADLATTHATVNAMLALSTETLAASGATGTRVTTLSGGEDNIGAIVALRAAAPGAATTGTAAATSLIVAAPASVVSGDLLVAHLGHRGSAAVTPPSGWTLAHAVTHPSTPLAQRIYTKVAGGSEPGSYTWTFDTAVQAAIALRRYGAESVDTSDPVADVDSLSHGGGTSGTWTTDATAPGLTAPAASSRSLVFVAVRGIKTVTPPGSYSEAYDLATADTTGVDVSIEAADRTVAAGATGDLSAVLSGAQDSLSTHLILRPATVTTPGRASSGAGTVLSLAVAPPSGVVSGDLLLAHLGLRDGGAVTPPAGWTLIDDLTHPSAGTSTLRSLAYSRVAGGSEPASHTWSFASAAIVAIAIERYSGVTASPSPVIAHSVTASPATADTTVPTTSLTATANDQLLIFLATARGIKMTTPAAGFAEAYDLATGASGGIDVSIASASRTPGAGATGAQNGTLDSGSNSIGHLILLNGGGSTVTPPATGTGRMGNDVTAATASEQRNSYLLAFGPFIADDSGPLTIARARISGGATSQAIRILVYANSDTGAVHEPGALIAASPEFTVAAGAAEAWVGATFASGSLVRDSRYWLTVWWGATGDAALASEYRIGGRIAKSQTYSTSGSPPDPFPAYTSGGVGSNLPCLYVEYTGSIDGVPVGSVGLSPAELPATTQVANHLASPHRWLTNSAYAPFAMADDYDRNYTWRDLEPSKNVYDFSVIEAGITAAAAAGRRYAFRLRAMRAPSSGQRYVPSHHVTDGLGAAKDDGTWVPNWNLAGFQARVAAIVAALGAQFNGRVGWVDIGIYGQYGEFVSGTSYTGLGFSDATATSKQYFVDLMLAAFPTTPVIFETADEVTMAYFLAQTTGRKATAGYRNNILGFTSAAGQAYHEQSQTVRRQLDRDWADGRPYVGEVGPQVSMNYRSLYLQVRHLRLHSVGNANFDLAYSALSSTQQADMDAAWLALGPRLALSRLDAPATITGAAQTWTFRWHNRNYSVVAGPRAYTITLRLRAAGGSVVWSQALSGHSLRALKPTTVAPRSIAETITVSGVPSGSYTAEIRIVDDLGRVFALAQTGVLADGGYAIGSVVVGAASSIALAGEAVVAVVATAALTVVPAVVEAPTVRVSTPRRLQIAIFEYADGPMVRDVSSIATGVRWGYAAQGCRDLQLGLPLSPLEAYALYSRRGMLHIEVNDGVETIWSGRVSDPSLIVEDATGVQITALGYSEALGDILTTALWVEAQADVWQEGRARLGGALASALPDRFTARTDGRLYLAPVRDSLQGSASYAGGRAAGALYLLTPSQGERPIVRVSFSYRAAGLAGTSWQAQLFRLTADGDLAAPATAVWSLTLPTTSTGTGSATISLAACDGLMLSLSSTAATARYTGEDGDVYIELTDVRVSSVDAASLEPAAVARALVATLAAANPGQIRADTSLIQDTGRDLGQLSYADARPGEQLAELAADGDGRAPWDYGVTVDRRVYLRPRGAVGRTYLVRGSKLTFEQTRSQLANSVYAVYEDAQGRTVRTPRATDALSAARYGLRRDELAEVQSSRAAEAQAARGVLLADRADPIPRASIDAVARIRDGSGAPVARWRIRPGDTLVEESLPPGLSAAIDRVRVFRVAEVAYNADSDELQITPEAPLPRIGD